MPKQPEPFSAGTGNSNKVDATYAEFDERPADEPDKWLDVAYARTTVKLQFGHPRVVGNGVISHYRGYVPCFTLDEQVAPVQTVPAVVVPTTREVARRTDGTRLKVRGAAAIEGETHPQPVEQTMGVAFVLLFDVQDGERTLIVEEQSAPTHPKPGRIDAAYFSAIAHCGDLSGREGDRPVSNHGQVGEPLGGGVDVSTRQHQPYPVADRANDSVLHEASVNHRP